MVQTKMDWLMRLIFTSHLRVLRLSEGVTIGKETLAGAPRFEPATLYEAFGVEDQRITRVGDTYYFTYVAVSKYGAATALASTRNFVTFE